RRAAPEARPCRGRVGREPADADPRPQLPRGNRGGLRPRGKGAWWGGRGHRAHGSPALMQKRMITISNKLGLHARASAKLTAEAAKFKSAIWISRNGRRVNAKSIMGVMMLAAGIGSSGELETDGPDEVAAIDAIEALFTTK